MNPALARIRWKLVLTSLIALVAALGFFYLEQWVYAFSDDECSWTLRKAQAGRPAQVVITQIIPDGVAEQAGLLEGDVLVEIQGKKVEASDRGTGLAQRQINEQPEGRVLLYTITRGGETLRVPVRLRKSFDTSHLILLISGLTAWLLGLVVVLSSPQRKISRHFYYLGVVVLVLSLRGSGQFLGNLPPWLFVIRISLAVVATSLFPPLWLHFFLRFPYPFPLRKNPAFLKGIYAFSVAVLLFLLVRGAFLGDGGPPLHGMFRTLDLEALESALQAFLRKPFLLSLFSAVFLAALGAGVACFWWGAFRLPWRRRRALLPAMGVTVALLLDFVVYQVLQGLPGNREGLLFQRQAWIFMTPLPLLPLAFAYGVVRHGLFDVRKAILRWLSYFTVLGAVGILYLGGISALFAYGFQSIPPVWMGAILGLTALPIGWMLRRLLQGLRRRFHRDLQSAREIVLASLRESKKRFNAEALLQGVREGLEEGFKPSRLDVLAFDGDALPLPPAEVDGETLPPRKLRIPPSLLRLARENRELVLGLGSDEADWVGEQGPELRGHLDALEVQVLVLVLVQDQPYRALLLGGKYSELNYSRLDRELLREAAIVASIVLETAVMHRRLMDQGRIEQELQTARRIQENLITSRAPDLEGFQMSLRLEPALETGGDLLWVKRRPSGSWLAAVGDVSGKGMAAALYMSQATALLEFATQRVDQPLEEILEALDRALRQLMGPRDFLTLTLLEWKEDGTYRLARAGHPPALHLRGSRPQDVGELAPFGRGLGLRPAGPRDWGVEEGRLGPKEWLVLYSDGLTEAMDRGGALYGLPRLKEQLGRVWGTGSPRAATEAVFRDVASFETQNRDDRTLLILGRDLP